MQIPAHLQIYLEEARRIIVKDIEFSGSTYQVLVEDPLTSEDYWVFIQLDSSNKMQDAFCSCDQGHSLNGCVHLTAAYCHLFDKEQKPLHERFAKSLWNHLFRLYADQIGDDLSRLVDLQPGHYVCQSLSEKVVFSIKALDASSREVLDEIIFKRPEETEETSLKFSNLSTEELILWREGAPSLQLRYDLSFWCDLAKWLMKWQEEGQPYEVSFKYSSRKIPNWIQVKFPSLEVGFYLSEANLPRVIPSLNTINSPLKLIENLEAGIEKISYDKKHQRLLITKKKINEIKPRKEFADASLIQVGSWTFVPEVGFFSDESHELMQKPIIEKEWLSDALTKHGLLIGKLIENCVVHAHPVIMNYQLSFDQRRNLHIESYLYEPGDLSHDGSCLIGDWVYLNEDGFYRIEDKRFSSVDHSVPVSQVSDFVTRNRGWLNTQEGFETHVRSLEYQTGYELSDSNRLTFNRLLADQEDGAQIYDFGSWVYYEGRGFYLKSPGSFNFLFKAGFSLSEEQIPLFIRMNRDELAFIPKFFNPICPVLTAGLTIELVDDQKKLFIYPKYELREEFQGLLFRLFDDVSFVEGHGFYELPPALRLPEGYRNAQTLEGEELDLFLANDLSSLQPFIRSIDPRLITPKDCDLTTTFVEKDLERGRGWYRFRFDYVTENGVVSALDLQKYLSGKKKRRFAFFDAGLIALTDHRFDWLRQIKKDRIDKNAKTIVLSTLEFMRLNAFNPICTIDAQMNLESRILFDELMNLKTPDEPDFGGLVSLLRPYQTLGVQWLWFLYTQNLSGLLCDDMGLGKTHQAMALLASVRNYFKFFAEGHPSHFLVVCPTSVIYHWQEKLQQFFPGIRVCTFYGTNRTLDNFLGEYDVLLTSYGILRNEKEKISAIEFEVAIYDEIQVAKNHYSLVYAALMAIKAKMKLGLTGTPIENHLRELKSLFDIVIPSYMPPEMEYRNFFVKPIEKGHDKERKQLLHRLVNPFVLRRKKQDVLTDLPEKIEEVAYCELLSDQQKLYVEVLEQRRRHLLEELRNEHEPVPYLHIFALLSSLKQICDHPAVYLKNPKNYQEYSSGKWILFIELLREARESSQKVVVFSQYLMMMDIIENYLHQENIGYSSVRGSTVDRREQMARFQTDPNCEVFVGSLQAAGLGIDLTAGSVVIHYDRWWNAARENQATDRVYRIGQKRGVQVFKLVTKDTFEEKIDKMITRKGLLMEEVIGVDDQSVLKVFTRQELMSLLDYSEIKKDEVKIEDSD